jgi:putative membrane protein
MDVRHHTIHRRTIHRRTIHRQGFIRTMMKRFSGDLINVLRGLLIGGADIIPGVSGGTVALILGIYERLVTAISHVDLTLLGHLRRREWKAAMVHLDLRFLVTLALGVGLGVVSLASLMNELLLEHPVPTWAAFFGLILASAVLVARLIPRWNLEAFGWFSGGAVFAFWLSLQTGGRAPDDHLYLVFCGVASSCAMILPGISGALILVILGNYERLTGAIKATVGVVKELLGRPETAQAAHEAISLGDALTTIVVFGVGWAIGLLGFSKFLRWLLVRHEASTMAVLCGFMFGALYKMWPFKKLVADHSHSKPDIKHQVFENVMPSEFSGEVLLALGMAIAAALLVFFIDRVAGSMTPSEPLEPKDHEPRDQ